MKKFAVFTNYGNWDTDSIGFVGFADVDANATPAEMIVGSVAIAHHDQDFLRSLISTDVKLYETHIEAIQLVYEEYEISMYVEPDFTYFGVCQVDGAMDLLCGIIEVV